MTYTVAADRDRRRERVGWHAAPGWTLTAASCLAVVAIALAYTGRFRALSTGSPLPDAAIVNLNTVRDAAELEPALAAVYDHPDDRRFAARTLFQFLTADPAKARALPNVGAIARATVSADAIREAKTLQAFAARLADARPGGDAAARVATIPLFTASDIATLKPYVAVRTRAEVRNRVLLLTALYVLAFHGLALMWRLRHRRRDDLAARHRASPHRHRLRGAPEPARSVARQPAVRPLRGDHHRRRRADGRPVARRVHARPASGRSAICR